MINATLAIFYLFTVGPLHGIHSTLEVGQDKSPVSIISKAPLERVERHSIQKEKIEYPVNSLFLPISTTYRQLEQIRLKPLTM
jgi:hypothetical protein